MESSPLGEVCDPFEAVVAREVKGHAVTVFVEAVVEQQQAQNVILQAEECSAYIWVPLDDLIKWHGKDKPDLKNMAWMMLEGWHTAGDGVESTKISVLQLHGIYPNLIGEGIGQGHLYALAKLAERDRRGSSSQASSGTSRCWQAAI
eukprot:Skav220776  [mRNA]  locus=scaffold3169:168442:171365:+ [translate_table: standard]